MDNKNLLVYTVVAGCLICIIAALFNVFTDMELPSRIMAAILGVVITATITQVLLQGQTKKEGTLKKESKVFEEKLRIYQNFLNTIYLAVKDHKLTEEQKMELQFQTSLIAMHCESENIETVSNSISQVLRSTCPKEGDSSIDEKTLLKGLFAVVEAFRKDLYGQEKSFNGKKDTIIDNFSEAISSANSDANYPRFYSANTAKQNIYSWDETVKLWRTEGWTVDELNNNQENRLVLKKSNIPGQINIGIYDGQYCIQAEYDNDIAFAKALQWKNGGKNCRDSWWKCLDEPYCDIPKDKLYETIMSNQQLQQQLIVRIRELQDIILTNYQTTTWKQKIDAYEVENWKTFIYNWKCLACQHQTKEKGTIFFDILPANDNQNMVEFRLGNRSGKRNCLEETLTILDFHDKIEDITKDCWACIYKVPRNSEEIAEKAKELMQEINLKIK